MKSEEIDNIDNEPREDAAPASESADNESQAKAEEKAPKPAWAVCCAAAAALCAIVAWCFLMFSDTVSVAAAIVSVAAAIAGICGLKRSFIRGMAITSLIASAILLFVYAIFFFGIRYAVSII